MPGFLSPEINAEVHVVRDHFGFGFSRFRV